MELSVYVDGQRRRDLHVEKWSLLPGPDFGAATVALAMPGRNRPDYRLEDLDALPSVGSRLQIRSPKPAGLMLFDGRVSKHVGRVGPDVEQLNVEAKDLLCTRLSKPVAGRWRVSGTSLIFVPDEKCVFNDDGDGMASPGMYVVHSRRCRVFQSAPGGGPWSVADVLSYLLAAHVPEDLVVPEPEEIQQTAGLVYPGRFSLTGLSVAQALAKAAGMGGLAVRGSIAFSRGTLSRGLVFYRPGRTGRQRVVCLQKHGQALDGRRSNLWKGTISLGRRPGRRGVLVLGDLKQYESTFELKRAWDPSLATYEHHSFVRSTAADWLAVKDVFRKWVLNEAGQYCAQPYDLSKFDFSTISGDFFLSVPRGFRPCLSVDSTGKSLGVFVELSYDSGSTWKHYGGPIRVSSEECTVHLTDDALPADYFQAALEQTLKVRLTATVDSDRRISAQADGDPNCGLELIEMPRAKWAKVHSGSIFYQSQSLPAPAERDDTGRLIQTASSLNLSQAGTVEADLVLAWLNPACNVGDIVDHIEGRQIDLAPFPGAAPHVQAVEHRCGQQWTTHLIVSG